MTKYHPESVLSSEEKLKRVAAKVGLSLPKIPSGIESTESDNNSIDHPINKISS